MSDSTLSKLESIRTKIRRLTKSPSEAQLTSETINNYINSFILYDLPTSVSLNNLKTLLKFYTEPHIDSYSTNTTDTGARLYNFKNLYTIASNTVFISGNLSYFTDSRSDFYNQYPKTITTKSVGTGDDTTFDFSGTLDNAPVLGGDIIFASTDKNDAYLKLYDDGDGVLTGDGIGTINYITGVYDITFSVEPGSGEDVYVNSCSYAPSMPKIVLFYQDTFHVRPVPDKCYSIEVEVYTRPTELMGNSSLPELSQWWEYIALGASRKILFDRSDFDTAGIIGMEMENQKENILYKTVIQNSINEGYGI